MMADRRSAKKEEMRREMRREKRVCLIRSWNQSRGKREITLRCDDGSQSDVMLPSLSVLCCCWSNPPLFFLLPFLFRYCFPPSLIFTGFPSIASPDFDLLPSASGFRNQISPDSEHLIGCEKKNQANQYIWVEVAGSYEEPAVFVGWRESAASTELEVQATSRGKYSVWRNSAGGEESMNPK